MTVRPTRRGLAVAIGAVAATVAGRVFGLPELTVAGFSGLALVALAAVGVATGGRGPELSLEVHPRRVHVDDRCEVRVRAAQREARPSPPVEVLDGGSTARTGLRVAPLHPGERASARLRFPTSRRGVHPVGPMRARITDPFRLAVRFGAPSDATTVVVAPRVVALSALPSSAGDEPQHGARSMASISTVDEEFSGLRPYVPGDDLRRIHWPSSARSGAAMVRQFEVPWQHRSTVVVDLRASRHHDEEAFERTLVVAASLVDRAARSSELIRFATTTRPSPPYSPAAEVLEAVLDQLAAAVPEEAVDGVDADDQLLVRALEAATLSVTGRLVVCTGRLDWEEYDQVRAVAARAGVAVVVTTGEDVDGGPIAAGQILDGVLRVHWDGTTPLADSWLRAASVLGERVGAR